jgi:hypothetical protein
MRYEMREALSFEQLKHWFRGSVGHSVSVQITVGNQTVAFLDGRIETVMGFENTHSHGLLSEGRRRRVDAPTGRA